MYISAKFYSSPNDGGRQLCKCLILTISPPFPQQSKTSYSTASWWERKQKYWKASFTLINRYCLQSFLFILLRFKSHQTLYVFVSLAHSFNTLLSYSIWYYCQYIQYIFNCLVIFNVSSTFRDDTMQHYFERWFLCSASLRDTTFKYKIGYLGVLLECKSLNC